MTLSRPKVLSGINGEELVRSTSSETIHLSMNDLLAERRRFEQYTREQTARLARLRECINEERAAASAELEKHRGEIVKAGIDKVSAELDEARHICQEQEQTLARTQADHQAEIQRLRGQLEAVLTEARDLRLQVTRQASEQAELGRRCRLYELAANETARLREELQRNKEDQAHNQNAVESLASLRKELTEARAETEAFRQREATMAQEVARLRGDRRERDQRRLDIAERAHELYRLIQEHGTEVGAVP